MSTDSTSRMSPKIFIHRSLIKFVQANFRGKYFHIRTIHSNQNRATQHFVLSKEAQLSRRIMSRYPGYILCPQSEISFVQDEKCSRSSHHASLLTNFQTLADTMQQQQLNAATVGPVLKEIIMNCSEFSHHNLIEAVRLFIRSSADLQRTNDRTTKALCRALDERCAVHCKHWTIDQLLYAYDMWVTVPYANRFKFASVAGQMLASAVDELTPKQMVQVLFYLSWYRILKVDRFEAPLARNLAALSLDELSVAALGFARTFTEIRSNQLILDIYTRLLNKNLDEFEDLSLVAIIKVCCLLKVLVCAIISIFPLHFSGASSLGPPQTSPTQQSIVGQIDIQHGESQPLSMFIHSSVGRQVEQLQPRTDGNACQPRGGRHQYITIEGVGSLVLCI